MSWTWSRRVARLPLTSTRAKQSIMNSGAQGLPAIGGADFIGPALAQMPPARPAVQVLDPDKATDAANPGALERFAQSAKYHFVRGGNRDRPLTKRLLAEFQPDALIHPAAEYHEDRSINDAGNIMGAHVLLDTALARWRGLEGAARQAFRLLHVSTDEADGSVGLEGLFREGRPYLPNSP